LCVQIEEAQTSETTVSSNREAFFHPIRGKKLHLRAEHNGYEFSSKMGRFILFLGFVGQTAGVLCES